MRVRGKRLKELSVIDCGVHLGADILMLNSFYHNHIFVTCEPKIRKRVQSVLHIWSNITMVDPI